MEGGVEFTNAEKWKMDDLEENGLRGNTLLIEYFGKHKAVMPISNGLW